MANRKKYIANLIRLERVRKKRLAKKLKRARKLSGRKQDALAKSLSATANDPRARASQIAGV